MSAALRALVIQFIIGISLVRFGICATLLESVHFLNILIVCL